MLTMTFPLQLKFRHMDPSAALESRIKNLAEGLGQFYDNITSCTVTIEAPHHHQHKGHRYVVRIRISVPGDVIVVSHESERNDTHEDPYVAVRDAFSSVRRQLQDYARLQRHQVKSHHDTSKRQFLAEIVNNDEREES